jgi:hypothetical protein
MFIYWQGKMGLTSAMTQPSGECRPKLAASDSEARRHMSSARAAAPPSAFAPSALTPARIPAGLMLSAAVLEKIAASKAKPTASPRICLKRGRGGYRAGEKDFDPRRFDRRT